MRFDELVSVTEALDKHYEELVAAGRATWSLDWELSNSGLSAYATIYTPNPDDYDESYRLRISDHPAQRGVDISVRLEKGVEATIESAIKEIEKWV